VFKITDGKGFHITFENGWTVSVQWGSGNYCDNYSRPYSENTLCGAEGSQTAEIAAWDANGKWYMPSEVEGRADAFRVAQFIAEVFAIRPTCEACGDNLTGHEDDTATTCRWCIAFCIDTTEGEAIENGDIE
jgi:hypothetical protein